MNSSPRNAAWWHARQPFSCVHASSPPAVLLAAKLLVLHPLPGRLRHGFDAPFLPFFEVLAAPALAPLWPWLLASLFWAGALSVLFNLAPRLGMAAAGAALTLDILAGRPRFSNSELLLGLLLVLLALTPRDDRSRWLLRGQLALLYGGAALNKLLAPDWRDGRFFSHWTGDVLGLTWYSTLDTSLAGAPSWFLGWFTIVTEFALLALALRPASTRAFILLGLAFHVGMLVFTGGAISWIFLFLIATAYLAFADDSAAPVWRPRPWWPFAAFALLCLGAWLKGAVTHP